MKIKEVQKLLKEEEANILQDLTKGVGIIFHVKPRFKLINYNGIMRGYLSYKAGVSQL